MTDAAAFDIVIFGATGYTGRLVAEHFARHYPADTGPRWALAGRSRERLAEVRDHLEAGAGMSFTDVTSP